MLRHERLLFGIATAGTLVHAIDEVFLVNEAYRAIPAAVLSIAVLVGYPRLTPPLRAVASLALGLFWLGGIATHWVPMLRDGPEAGDWTSLVSVPAGALFLALGFAILARMRAGRTAVP